MRVEVPLRWADLDAQEHVNNARYIDYLQDARAEFLYALKLPDLLKQGFTVVSNQIEYYRPVYFSDVPLDVDVTVAGLTHDDVTLAYRLYQAGDEVAAARTTLSGFDLATGARKPIPEYAHEAFTDLLVPAQPLRPLPWAQMTSHAKVSEMRVRWSDIDAYGHVNNALIFDYVQEGRINFTAAPLRGTGRHDDRDYLWLMARQDVFYLNRVVFRHEPYIIRTGVARVGTTSMTFSSQVDDPLTGMVCSTASAVTVLADSLGHPTPIPDDMREKVAPYQLN